MRIYPTGSILIQEIANGFVVIAKGRHEDQEDGLDNKSTYVFNDVSVMTEWLKGFIDERKESKGSKA